MYGPEAAIDSGELGNPTTGAAVPDILIDGPGHYRSNLIAIEVKIDAYCDSKDIAKIWATKSEPKRYLHGVLLALLVDEDRDGAF